MIEEELQIKLKLIIKILCISKNIKIGELEDYLKVSTGYFSRKNTNISIYCLTKICEKLEIDLIELLKLVIEKLN